MAGNKKLWPFTAQQIAYGRRVSAGIAPDVGHENVALLHFETEHIAKTQAYVAPVYIAAHGTHRAICGQAVNDKRAANVAGMPYLVAPGEMDKIFVIPTTVRVGEDADARHQAKRFATS